MLKDIVQTPHGMGEVVKREAVDGYLRDRYLVRVFTLSDNILLQNLQNRQGGLFYFEKDLKVIEAAL